MDFSGLFDLDGLMKKGEAMAPKLGGWYGFLAPLAATGAAVGDDPISAIVRELSAVVMQPKIPTLPDIKGWFTNYSLPVAKNGLLVLLGGELLGNTRISEAGANAIKGSIVAALIGAIGQGGGAPYGDVTNPPHPYETNNQPTPSQVAKWIPSYY